MTKHTEPLDADLRALFDAERGRGDPPDEMRAAVRQRVLAAAVLPSAAGAGSAASSASTGGPGSAIGFWAHPIRLLLATAAVGTVSVVGVRALMHHARPDTAPAVVVKRAPDARPAPVAAPIQAPAPSLATPAPTVAPGRTSRPRRPAEPVGPPPVPVPPTAVPTTPSVADTDLAVERTLLERARRALSSGQPREALSIAAMHQRRYPQGRLVEERERLCIQALMAAGEAAEARKRAAAFRRDYPRSIFLRDVDAAVGGAP
jgi:hypothetical protein